MTKLLGLVAEFHKKPRKRLELCSLSVHHQTINCRGEPWTSRDIYDVNLSKRYGYLFDLSGGGASEPVQVAGLYFARGNIRISESPCRLIDPNDKPPYRDAKTKAIRALNRTRRLYDLPKYFRGDGNLWEWLQSNGIESESVYCGICTDWFPEEQLCEHCWWCQEVCWYSTPSDRCGCATLAMCDGDFGRDEEAFAFAPNHPPLRGDPSWAS